MPKKEATKKRKSPKKKEPSLSEISPGVFVGGWKDAEKFVGKRFCVLDEAPPDMPEATHIRILDDSGNRADRAALDRLADAVTAAHGHGDPVLIFCGHGVMRSPLAGMWYLRRATGVKLDEAFEKVHAQRSRAVHPKAWLENAVELQKP